MTEEFLAAAYFYGKDRLTVGARFSYFSPKIRFWGKYRDTLGVALRS